MVHKENGGATSSRKMGTEIATGDYIFYVDSDDRIKPNTLQTVAEILLKAILRYSLFRILRLFRIEQKKQRLKFTV